jgi:SagB-type dehydrogenase family enzyme
MKKNLVIFILLFCCSANLFSQVAPVSPVITTIKLPEPDLNGKVSLEQAIKNRRSIRQFTAEPLKINQIAQLCWSAQGITDEKKGFRAAPSAGAIYPMQLYVVLPDGLYLYYPASHTLEKEINSDIRPMLYTASFRQQVVQNSPCIFIISGSVKKIEAKFRGRGERFICLEAGHIAQNIHLQAVTLGLGSVPIGGFDPKSVAAICKLTEELEPLYLICTGNPIEKPSLVPAVSVGRAVAPAIKQPVDIRTKRVVIIVAKQYFDDTEFFGAEEAFKIAGIQPDIASSMTGEIKSFERRNTVTATVLVKDIKVDDYDAFVFIGGPGASEYFDDNNVLRLVRQANAKKKILAASYIAPGIFARADIVRNKKVASSPSQRSKLIDAGADWKNTDLEIAGNIITASGPNAARRFGIAVLAALRQQNE